MIIDFHAHILPRCDHGCSHCSVAQSQLLMMRAAGTGAVVATPHFYPSDVSVESFLDRRAGALAAMRHRLPLEDLPAVYPAAEVLVCPGLHEMEGLEKLTVSGTNVILLEMPFTRWGEALIHTVLGVRERGLTPVLAHIDRYELDEVQKLLRHGVQAQVNAEVFGALKNPRPYVELMRAGKVVALGSDLHGESKAHYKRFLRMQKKLGPLADEVFARSAELLKNATPIYHPEREKQAT